MHGITTGNEWGTVCCIGRAAFRRQKGADPVWWLCRRRLRSPSPERQSQLPPFCICFCSQWDEPPPAPAPNVPEKRRWEAQSLRYMLISSQVPCHNRKKKKNTEYQLYGQQRSPTMVLSFNPIAVHWTRCRRAKILSAGAKWREKVQ